MAVKTLAFIFARGGSKGIPGKNIAPLGGKPLIAHSIEMALAHPLIDDVVVSTDDEQIAHVARSYGAKVPFMRPAELASDTASEWLAWQHAVAFCRSQPQWQGFSTFISLPATAPLRAAEDVTACLQRLWHQPVDMVLTGTAAARSPYFNMVEQAADGRVSLVLPGQYQRRQDAPPLFDLTTVAYAADPDFILANQGIWQGRVSLIEVPRERAIDIDEPLDLFMAQCLYERRLSASVEE